ncbi:protein of unknown function [Pseudomonas marincola]|uniref:Uncharacterized protein n=1 Tax=Pseudomonas marincola TaxID=437900 RepID=A0A8S2BAY2_9PSED|nr:protein of unknown function [Pseudomonas marincola]
MGGFRACTAKFDRVENVLLESVFMLTLNDGSTLAMCTDCNFTCKKHALRLLYQQPGTFQASRRDELRWMLIPRTLESCCPNEV